MAARWLIAALCFAKVLTVLGAEKCHLETSCTACRAKGCDWCVATVELKPPKEKASQTEIPAAAACSDDCTGVLFGKFGKMFHIRYEKKEKNADGKEEKIPGEVNFLALAADSSCSADEVSPVYAKYLSCAGCMKFGHVWCPLSYEGDLFDTHEGALCVPGGTACDDFPLPALPGLKRGEELAACATPPPTPTFEGDSAAAVVPHHGGKLLFATLAASVTAGVLLL